MLLAGVSLFAWGEGRGVAALISCCFRDVRSASAHSPADAFGFGFLPVAAMTPLDTECFFVLAAFVLVVFALCFLGTVWG